MSRRLAAGIRRRAHAIAERLREAISALRDARSDLLRRRRAKTREHRRILVVDELVPDSRYGAGYPRAAEMLRALVDAGWDVTMYPMIGSRTEHETMRERFAGCPVHFVRSRGPEGLRRLMIENIDSFDVVWISRPENMQIYSRLSAALPAFEPYCVYDAEAIFAAREFRRRALFGNPMTDEEYEGALDEEIALVGRADALTTVTEAEASLFRSRSDVPVHVIKHSITVRSDTQGFDERTDLLFVGRCAGPRNQSPNVDSLHWFVRDIMPLIDAAMGPNYRLVVAGLADDAIVSALGSDRVVFKGIVDELGPLYDTCRIFVAPTRFAAGIPLKVVEAAAAGIPCVVTEILAGQLGFQNDIELLAAASNTEFAVSCVALYRRSDLWHRIRDTCRQRVTAEYSRARFGSDVRKSLAM